MNIYSIAEDSVALNEIGHAIDTPQKIKLEMGLLRLIPDANADQLLFWGKIFTTNQPYYIAVSIDFKSHYAFPKKTFFYATSNFNFQPLPQLDTFNRSFVDEFNDKPLTGDPKFVLRDIAAEGEQKKQEQNKNNQQQLDSDDQEANNKIEPKRYLQEDRLAYTVRAIEQQCQLVPKRAFKMCVEHEIRYNDKFTAPKSTDLNDFVHFRYPHSQVAINTLESAQAIFRDDIFDQIQNQSQWSLQTNTQNNLVTVRSFLWPGYIAYSFTNRNVFGGLYFGNGLKNVQLPFFI